MTTVKMLYNSNTNSLYPDVFRGDCDDIYILEWCIRNKFLFKLNDEYSAICSGETKGEITISGDEDYVTLYIMEYTINDLAAKYNSITH